MKVLCIESGVIDKSTNSKNSVKENQIYTTSGDISLNRRGKKCYFIEEVIAFKRIERFVPCSEKDELIKKVYESEKAL